MRPVEFSFWLKGIVGSDLSPADLSAAVLRQAAEVLDRVKVFAKPPQMRGITVPQFCIHNIHRKEYCAGCVGKFVDRGVRSFAITLPDCVAMVYTNAEERLNDQAPRTDADEAGDKASEREGNAVAEDGAGAKIGR